MLLAFPQATLLKGGLLTFVMCVSMVVFLGHLPHPPEDMLHMMPPESSRRVPRDNLLDVRNSTWGFSKIFVLNMEDRVDKRDLWALATLHYNMTIEYLNGVNGEKVAPKARPANWDIKKGNTNAPALGSWRAHMNAVQK